MRPDELYCSSLLACIKFINGPVPLKVHVNVINEGIYKCTFLTIIRSSTLFYIEKLNDSDYSVFLVKSFYSSMRVLN